MIESQACPGVTQEWRRINMRNVAHAMGVEFIHDLYNRHEHKINSIRFRNTVTTWKDGIVNSYAPEHEWERLGSLLGEQFYSLNPLIIKNTKALYRRKREHYYSFVKNLKKTDLKKLSGNELACLLINFQSVVLGELYVLNFVQIEHGLTTAIKRRLGEILKDAATVEENFVNLIRTEKPTESQKENLALSFLALKWKMRNKLGLGNTEKMDRDVGEHARKFSYLYSAYGENPKSVESFRSAFRELMAAPKLQFCKPSFMSALLSRESRAKLRSLSDKKLNVLIPLLVMGGIYRDKNKALLGQTVRYRFEMLDETASRGIETRKNLDFYLLNEIVELLRSGTRLDPRTIESRKKCGMVFRRNEDCVLMTDENLGHIPHPANDKKILRGQCASKGECRGVCKIVRTKHDNAKVNQGDIMVAIGTDFDLIEAMYRAGAVITEEGGILSHASVVCREIEKPCCIAVKHATTILRDGQRACVNATKGEICLED